MGCNSGAGGLDDVIARIVLNSNNAYICTYIPYYYFYFRRFYRKCSLSFRSQNIITLDLYFLYHQFVGTTLRRRLLLRSQQPLTLSMQMQILLVLQKEDKS